MQRVKSGIGLCGLLVCATSVSAALPEAGLFVDVKSRVTDFDTLQLATTGPTLARPATEADPLTLGEKLVGTDSVTFNNLTLTDGLARSGLASGLGVSAYASLPFDAFNSAGAPRRTRVDAKATHIRNFVYDSPGDSTAVIAFDVFLHGELELLKTAQDALAAPGNNLLYSFVSIEASLTNESGFVPNYSLYDSALLTTNGLQLSPGFQDPNIYLPNGETVSDAAPWTLTQLDGSIKAQVSWLTKPSNIVVSTFDDQGNYTGTEPGLVIPANSPFSVTYTVEVTTFVSYDFNESNAIDWESYARFANTATMDIRSLSDTGELVELTPQVPEPASALLLLPAALGTLARRRRSGR